MKKITTLLLFVFSIICYGQEEVLLRLKYKTGDHYKMAMIMKQDMGSLMTNNMTFIMSQKITNTTDSIYENTMTIDQVKMEITKSGEETKSFDSSKDIEEGDDFAKQMNASLGKMIGVEFFSKGNFQGEILEIKVDSQLPGLENMTNKGNVVYPKEAVKVGSQWKITQSQEGMDMNFVYEVSEITDSYIKVKVSGTISGLGNGTISGILKIKRETGIPELSNIKMDLEVLEQKILTEIEMKMVKI